MSKLFATLLIMLEFPT